MENVSVDVVAAWLHDRDCGECSGTVTVATQLPDMVVPRPKFDGELRPHHEIHPFAMRKGGTGCWVLEMVADFYFPHFGTVHVMGYWQWPFNDDIMQLKILLF